MKLLRPACHPICDRIFNNPVMSMSLINRMHATCLTCPLRRYYYYGEQSGFSNHSQATIIASTASSRKAPIPQEGIFTYCVFVKLNCPFPRLKDFVVKLFMIFMENVAAWNCKPIGFKRQVIWSLQSKTIVLPRSLKTYFVFLPYRDRFKCFLIKFIGTFTERIAEI